MGPFDRFNDRAKRVLALAQDEAIRFGHNYMGVEHLLLGLVREGEGVAARVLESFGVELGKVRTSVEQVVGRNESTTPPSEITLSPRLKKVIELAIEEAKKLGHSHVGTEHLLLGIVREGESIASGVLRSLGVELEKIRDQTVATLAGHGVAVRGPHGPRFANYYDAQGKKRDWFCEDVLSGKVAVRTLHEDERVIAFHHPDPAAPIHVVVIPKAHIASLLAPEALDGELLRAVINAVQVVTAMIGLDRTGFYMRINAATPDVTPHMHWHVMGPGVAPITQRAP
jgi:diadenosine tetraphosphate (Ap4A) HIT family hydrolase